MAEDRTKFHRTGGGTDVDAQQGGHDGPPTDRNPDETRRGTSRPGQVSQEGGTTAKPEPKTDAGAPGRMGDDRD